MTGKITRWESFIKNPTSQFIGGCVSNFLHGIFGIAVLGLFIGAIFVVFILPAKLYSETNNSHYLWAYSWIGVLLICGLGKSFKEGQ